MYSKGIGSVAPHLAPLLASAALHPFLYFRSLHGIISVPLGFVIRECSAGNEGSPAGLDAAQVDPATACDAEFASVKHFLNCAHATVSVVFGTRGGSSNLPVGSGCCKCSKPRKSRKFRINARHVATLHSAQAESETRLGH